jgi:flagellar biogenesis protein FliO
MFGRISRNFSRSSFVFSEAINLSSLVGRWLPFAARRSAIGASLQHIATLPLTPQSSVALIRVYDETLVLGITAQRVTLLTKAGGEKSDKNLSREHTVAGNQENCGCVSEPAPQRMPLSNEVL